MEKHKLKDFIDATKEEAGNVAVEEVLPAVVKEAGGFIVSEGVGMLASEIVGAVVPVANNIRLSYKQNRLERNVVEALQIVQRNQDELENKIVKLQQSNLEYQRQITEALLDNIVEEPQEAMVKYNVNGYVNLLKSDNTNLDIVLMFFKTLSQLSDLETMEKIFWTSVKTFTLILNKCDSSEKSSNDLDFCKVKTRKLMIIILKRLLNTSKTLKKKEKNPSQEV